MKKDIKSEDVFGFLKEVFEDVEKETRDKVDEKYYTWSEHYDNWISIAQLLLPGISEFDKYNSMTFFRFVELQNQIVWILISVLYGAYHHAIRELRYVLDSMLQAYYLDKEHPEADMYCKLEILKEIEKEMHGGRLINRLDIEYKDNLKGLYSVLSKYVHSSYEELKPVIEEGKVATRITPTFDEDLFNKCVDFTNQVMDAVYFVIFNRFPQLVSKIRDDTITKKSLKKLRCEMSLKSLKTKI